MVRPLVVHSPASVVQAVQSRLDGFDQLRHEYPIPHLAHWRCFIEIPGRLPVFRV